MAKQNPDDDSIPVSAVCPFAVCVDSREQAPFRFLSIDPFTIVPLHHCGLITGDYSIRGLESQVTIERKSIPDFLSSITAGRERFQREFERMAEMKFAAVVVEGELSQVLQECKAKTRIAVDSVLGTIDSWSVRYGVHMRFCPGRRFAEIQTLKLLCQFWRHWRTDKE